VDIEENQLLSKILKSNMVQLAFRPIEIRVKLPKEGEQTHLISISSDSNLTDFRKIIAEKFKIPAESQRFISSGTEIKIEKDFTLLKQQPTPNIHVIAREVIQNSGITDSSEESEVTKKYKFCWTLIENVNECIKAYHNGTSPNDRPKHNNASRVPMRYPERGPCCEDFGELIEEVSQTFASLSDMMAQNSEILRRGEGGQANQDKIQLMMDLCRYHAVLDQTIAKFIVPLRHEPPRFLSFSQNPVRRAPRS